MPFFYRSLNVYPSKRSSFCWDLGQGVLHWRAQAWGYLYYIVSDQESLQSEKSSLFWGGGGGGGGGGEGGDSGFFLDGGGGGEGGDSGFFLDGGGGGGGDSQGSPCSNGVKM